ncbi:MAG: Fic family protein [Bifidobacteriaceae bacterium]|nr:Fic family protein [Bifidobacteriaceae bacterium]
MSHLLIRSESISSSWIEGNRVSPKRLAIAELLEQGPREALAVVANVHATEAAIVHAQFETIHPFIDGNGRTGRALIHTVLRRADALRHVLIPISTVFAGDTDSYIAGLAGYRADPPQLDEWVIAFARAAERAAGHAVRFAEDIAALDAQVHDDLARFRRSRGINPVRPRRDAAVLRILGTLTSVPVLTAASASAAVGVSPAAAHRALSELADAGIMGRTRVRGRLLCWTADRHLALVGRPERLLGDPGDARGHGPVRIEREV